MNKQLKTNGAVAVSRGIEWCGSSFAAPHPAIKTYPWTLPDGRIVYLADNGRTSNPIGGCHFGCQWTMPDGSEAICYAKRVAEGVAGQAFPDGFAPTHTSHGHTTRQVYWRPEELEAWKTAPPSEIFVGSMADLFGPWLDHEDVTEYGDDPQSEVLDAMWGDDVGHRFYILTKNAPALTRVIGYGKPGRFPSNVWVGASIPPSRMGSVTLDADVQRRMLEKMIDSLRQVEAGVKWLSLEPLSWDAAEVLSEVGDLGTAIRWMVIGAATNGAKTFQPEPRWVERLLDLCDEYRVPVFFKGNLEWDRGRWREDKPEDAFMRRLTQPAHLTPGPGAEPQRPPKIGEGSKAGEPVQLDLFGGAL